jgi:hypothetical protein
MSSTCKITPSDIYAQMLEVKTGSRGCMTLTKKDAKAGGVAWSFVESAVSILGLKIVREGRWGFLVSRA